MKRFFVENITHPITLLQGENHTHLSVVTRAKLGEEVVLCAQDGFDYTGVITKFTKTETEVSIKEKYKNENEPNLNLTAFLALTKGDKIEFAAQKLTELGISKIVPMETTHTLLKAKTFKTDRLKKIVHEAAKQCGRGVLPIVEDAVNFKQVISSLNSYNVIVFPYEKATECDAKQYLKDSLNGKNVAFLIGAEGGFTEQEVSALTDLGVRPITLGKRILRAETAAIAVATMIMYEGDQMK